MSSNNNLVTLTITSSTLTAKDITDALQITPTIFHERGTPINFRNPDKGLREKTSWLFRSQLSRESKMQEKIEGILYLIENNLTAFKKISVQTEIELYCSFFLKEKSDVFFLPSIATSKLSLIPIDIIVVIYPCDHNEED